MDDLHGRVRVVYRCYYGHRFEALVRKPEDPVQCPTCPAEWIMPSRPDEDQISPAPGTVVIEVPSVQNNPNLYPPEAPYDA